MAWEKVKFYGTKGEPKLALRKNMQIGMNSTFVKRYKVDDYDGAEVFVDKETMKIGIRLCAESDGKDTAKIKKKERNYYFTVKQLKNLYGIDPERHELGKVEHNEEERMFVVEIMKRKKNRGEEEGEK